MPVVFTGNTRGTVIKDRAYENSGQGIVVGRINQSAVPAGPQLITLSGNNAATGKATGRIHE